ncbi:putative transcription factor C2H2 family [Lupinus albus]|uniref:Putative transcription factor C2H2 family n=1 Tax=Lupinus albus TaxID=3870 RepID=A0A6A4NR75_LUPAL|nr:putative transcription factor C2H2 family [Lupinus albus]
MSDQGERTCPLCAEEMDLTDQQLKPCKCGYEICVWCWHHIMDMAEKDDTEGRCPACRSAYDKEKIVGMASNCERLLNGVNVEKKMKNQKAKSKSSDGRKQLSSVRVIQRNLVYIVGLPLNLGDEDLLQRWEYFGQYGKVLKVSMSRTAAGVIQQLPNDACSVYITYSKEYEAIRCIQNVHGFILEGKPLRACFGTTKYCHAWLRNVPCNNPDCLYLHEVGLQEDSFSKDEVISAYTRSRVQQITGATINTQRRSGNVLPPPMDDSVNNSSGKPIMGSASSNTVSTVRCSPPNGMYGRPVTLPASAAWGTQATNCQPPAEGLSCPNGSSNSKSYTVRNMLDFSAVVAGTIQAPALHSDITKRPHSGDGSNNMMPRVKNESFKPAKQYNSMDTMASAGEKTLTSDDTHMPGNLNGQLSSMPLSQDSDRGSSTTANTVNSTDLTGQSHSSDSEEAITITNEEIQHLSGELSSINIDRNDVNEPCGISKPSSPPPDDALIKSPQIQELQYSADQFRDVIITNGAVKAATSDNGVCNSIEQSEWGLDSQSQVLSNIAEVEDDVTSFDNQRLEDPEVVCHSYLPNSTSFLHVSNHYTPRILQHTEPFTAVNAGSLSADDRVRDGSLLHSSSLSCNGYPEKLVSGSSYGLPRDKSSGRSIGRLVSELVNAGHDAAIDKGESCIISNILSMDFDAWDDSLTSPHNLAKLLGDNTDNQSGPLKKSSSLKLQSNNQSRFSFARQEEPKNQNFDIHPSYAVSQQQQKRHPFIQDFVERDLYTDKYGIVNGFPTSNFEQAENIGGGHFVASSNMLSAISRAQVSAPPGFSVPSRPPPPGFSSHERVGHAFDSISGNSLLDHSSMRNSYQTPSAGNIGSAGDVEFMDPAILAVGKGRHQSTLNSPAMDMRSNFRPQLNHFETEARLQLLMQRSLSTQQNPRYPEIGESLSQLGDSYGISSRLDQQVNNLAPFPRLSLQQSTNAVLSNGQWDGWNGVQTGNNLEVAELLRNERLGFNKFYSGYDDSKYRMPNSGDLYNRTFGI